MGKVRRGWIQDGIDLYLKRLPGLTISELRDSNPDKEADAIRAALRPDETLIALMEQGDTLASVPFAPAGTGETCGSAQSQPGSPSR